MLQDYKRTLSDIRESVETNKDVWRRLEAVLSSLTPEQTAYIRSNNEVIERKQLLMQHFTDWLFEKYKSEFVAIDAFRKETEAYVVCLEESVKDFADHNQRVLADYDNKVKELEELKEKLKAMQEIQI